MPEVLTVIMLLIGCILILVAAYYVTKWITKRGYSVGGSSSANIRIIDRVMLAPDRSLLIARAAGKTLLLGMTQQHIELLCELSADELAPLAEKSGSAFSDTFKEVLKTKWGIGSGGNREGGDKPNE